MNHKAFGQKVISAEADGLSRMVDLLDESFDRAVDAILACTGRVVITGVGKPWLIGQKISATLASTGTPSFGLHPSEAMHGDLGRIRREDVVIAISNSGASEEVVRLLPLLKRDHVLIIGITAKPDSDLGRLSDIVLNMGANDEACPLNLAPSVSTTCMLAMGDALALAVMEARGFSREDYARFHPGGALGRRLMLVEEIMRPLAQSATVPPDASIKSALFAITQKRSGACFIIDDESGLLGVFTDGDLRRHIDDAGFDLEKKTIAEVMTSPGLRISRGQLAMSAAGVMKERRIDELPVVDDAGRFLGHVDIQDLLTAGLI